MTSFGAFLQKGGEVLAESNFNVWGNLGDLSYSTIFKNLGFWVSLAFWGSFLLFMYSLSFLDRVSLSGNSNLQSALSNTIDLNKTYSHHVNDSSVSSMSQSK